MSVGNKVGSVGFFDGITVGIVVGYGDGLTVGIEVGYCDGITVGIEVGYGDGIDVGRAEGFGLTSVKQNGTFLLLASSRRMLSINNIDLLSLASA